MTMLCSIAPISTPTDPQPTAAQLVGIDVSHAQLAIGRQDKWPVAVAGGRIHPASATIPPRPDVWPLADSTRADKWPLASNKAADKWPLIGSARTDKWPVTRPARLDKWPLVQPSRSSAQTVTESVRTDKWPVG
jgi:hypothetical protein